MNGPAESPDPVRDEHAVVKQRSLRAVKWSALTELLARSVQPLMLLALARLLTPAEFGVVGVATIVIGLAQIFQEFGVGRALVQTRDDVAAFANNAFWINLAIGAGLYAALFAGAQPIADFFQSPSSAGVLRVLGLQIVLTSLVSVQAAMLQRDIRFKALFFVRFLPTLVTGALSVALAWRGHGVWALVWGTLSGSGIQVVLYWWASPWRPQPGFDWPGFRRMFAFSRWVLLESALAWVVSWGDSIALGHFLGPETLGQYRVGSVVVAYLSNILFTPLVPVAFGLLSRLQDDRAAFADTLGKLTRMVVMISLPVAAGAALLGQPITVAVLGTPWAQAGIVVQMMGLRMGLEWLVGLNSTAFIAIGRPDMNVKLLVLAVLIAVPFYIWAGPLGLLTFCWARLVASQLTNALSYPFARRVLALPPRFLWDRVRFPLAACAIMAGLLAGAIHLLPAISLALAVVLVVAGAAAYAGSLWWFDRAALTWGWGALRQVFARGAAAVSPSLTTMAAIFEWNQSDFDKLVANCPSEPVTPFVFKYFPAGSHLLEAGCGSGRFVYWLAEKGYAIEGVEIGEKAVADLNQRFPHLKIRQGDVCHLPYADNSFDGILSLGVIEHVYAGMDESIREMHRVLKPGGVALVIVPCFNLVRRLKYFTGIYHLHALLGYVTRWNPMRRLFGKRPHQPTVDVAPPRLPPWKRWPMFGEFYEYRLTKAEFQHELTTRGFSLLESVPTSLIDGLYLEFGRPFVRFGHLEFHPNATGRWLNGWLSRRPYWHNHMQLCVVRKEAGRAGAPEGGR